MTAVVSLGCASIPEVGVPETLIQSSSSSNAIRRRAGNKYLCNHDDHHTLQR